MSSNLYNKVAPCIEERFKQLRTSLKQLPIITQKTNHLHQKLQNIKNGTTNQALTINIFNNDAQSVQGDSSISQVGFLNSFLDKYDLLEKINEGGNSCVYKCRHKQNGKIYAVKKFQIEEQHLSNLKKIFISLQGLNHPSIIKYRALHFDRRNAYLVMQHISCPNLIEYKIKNEEQLKNIIRQIIGAVRYIHDRNISHRDIKPENILYNTETKKIKLIDFEIAKKTFQRGYRRDMLTIIGTHYYLAPEVYIGGGYDERVDLWAIGITIYKLITGRTPFESEYHSDTISNIIQGKICFDDSIWKNYGIFAKDFVSRLLRRKEERISLADAQKHLYIAIKHSGKISRYNSHYMSVNQDFHNEMKNKVSNSLSREEGGSQSGKTLFKSLKLIGVGEFDLEDSDDEELVLCTKTLQRNRSVKLHHKNFSLNVQLHTQI